MLLERGADVNLCDTEGSGPPLFSVMRYKNKPSDAPGIMMMEKLLQYGANVNQQFRTYSGDTCPLFVAIDSGNMPGLQFLIHNGADTNKLKIDREFENGETYKSLVCLALLANEFLMAQKVMLAGCRVSSHTRQLAEIVYAQETLGSVDVDGGGHDEKLKTRTTSLHEDDDPIDKFVKIRTKTKKN